MENKTKEEILKAAANKLHEKDKSYMDFETILKDSPQAVELVYGIMDEYNAHLTEKIKSMENYISDVDGQVKELRELNKELIDINSDYRSQVWAGKHESIDELESQLESLQKENTIRHITHKENGVTNRRA